MIFLHYDSFSFFSVGRYVSFQIGGEKKNSVFFCLTMYELSVRMYTDVLINVNTKRNSNQISKGIRIKIIKCSTEDYSIEANV